MITLYIIGLLINYILVCMAEAYYDLTLQQYNIDRGMLNIVMAMSFLGTPFIYLSFKNEINWTWNNLIRRK